MLELNILQALKDAGFSELRSRSYKIWCKRITGINFNKTNGYSLEGPFISDIDESDRREPGLYLFHCWQSRFENLAEEAEYRNKHPYARLNCRRCILFEIGTDGKLQIVADKICRYAKWAPEIWPEIEAWFQAQSAASEEKRNYILNKIAHLEAELAKLKEELQEEDRKPRPYDAVLGGGGSDRTPQKSSDRPRAN